MIEYGDARLPERFWIKVYPCPITGCWLWAGAAKKRGGYGTYFHEGQAQPVSHVLASIKYPGWDKEKFGPVLSCKNNACANPEHVELRDRSLCRNGHKKTKRGRGTNCNQCRREWDKNNRPQRRSYQANQLTKKPKLTEVSVFGDRIPDKPWRPAGFSEEIKVGV